MSLRCIGFAGISLVTLLCGCSSSKAGSVTPPIPTSPLSADASLHQLQFQGKLPTLDVSSSLLGTDSDGNGVRDDIDKYLAGLPDTVAQKKALTQLAQAIQSTLIVDRTNATDLAKVTNSISRAEACIWRQYAPSQPTQDDAVEALTINTKVRLATYEQYSAAVNGSVIQSVAGSTACN